VDFLFFLFFCRSDSLGLLSSEGRDRRPPPPLMASFQFSKRSTRDQSKCLAIVRFGFSPFPPPVMYMGLLSGADRVGAAAFFSCGSFYPLSRSSPPSGRFIPEVETFFFFLVRRRLPRLSLSVARWSFSPQERLFFLSCCRLPPLTGPRHIHTRSLLFPGDEESIPAVFFFFLPAMGETCPFPFDRAFSSMFLLLKSPFSRHALGLTPLAYYN